MMIESPATQPEESSEHMPTTARDLFDALPPLPGLRAEVIEGNLIVSPLGSPEHTFAALHLYDALSPLCRERGWLNSPGGLTICVDGPRDAYVPDYLVVPADCPLWGNEYLSSKVIMAAEIVSPGSVRIDREEKPRLYAFGGVPIYLRIDPIAETPTATVYSNITDGAYLRIVNVALGKPLMLPSPIDYELDTSVFRV
ncbi:Uma2 family endonuclease [Nonomuraea fuscirosea]|uniref:Uma2 family endonuclease n=1 Tax=Nonomuraea fuscirosea TaxID=1291556 RepID=UPI0034291F9A